MCQICKSRMESQKPSAEITKREYNLLYRLVLDWSLLINQKNLDLSQKDRLNYLETILNDFLSHDERQNLLWDTLKISSSSAETGKREQGVF